MRARKHRSRDRQNNGKGLKKREGDLGTRKIMIVKEII